MKFIAAVSALLSLAVAAPVEVAPRDTTAFEVSDFKAWCNPGRGGCNWTFKLVQLPNKAVINCKGSIPNVDRFPEQAGFHRCDNGDTIFQFQHFEAVNNYRLQITDGSTVGSTIAGSKLWEESSFPIYRNTKGTFQAYSGPTDFTLPRNP